MRKRSMLAALLAATLTVPLTAGAPAGAKSDPFDQFVHKVDVNGMMQHVEMLQDFADSSDVLSTEGVGTRLAGSSGYDDSSAYFADLMDAAGYDVTVQEFTFTGYRPLGPSTLEQTAPGSVTYVEDTDYNLMSQTEPGDVSGGVVEVDLALGNAEWPADPSTSSSGCDYPGDFAGFTPGSIALMQRGACTFALKAENAAAAGAVGAIIFNQGNTAARMGLINGTLSSGYTGGIPAFSATYPNGVDWAGTDGLEMHMIADVFRDEITTTNVLADSPVGDPDSTVVVGAHLDSVPEGPGIQDNGSGSALVAELGTELSKAFHFKGKKAGQGKGQYKDMSLNHRVRFAWWGAEESGLVGSDHYVFTLPPAELAQIGAYLNFDMIASPNFFRGIYDGDGSDFGLAGPSGSDTIEAMFEARFDAMGLAHQGTEISFRSDYAAFFDSGIPFGGLFTGAEGIKTPAQVTLYGGTAGDQYDPCYHLACDDLSNITANGKVVWEQNAGASAHVLLDLLTGGALPS